MIDINSSSGCEKARAYYYEYLCQETQVNIPHDIAAHIKECDNCQAEVERLESLLVESIESSDSNLKEKNLALITNSNLHFSYIGELVSCSTVRPFLPSLADPLLKIRIPTPITVHLDKCSKCEADLQKIIELELSHKQLCRLGQLFAEIPFESQASCFETNASIDSVVSLEFDDLSEDILKHVCICSDCRSKVYHQRESFKETITGKTVSKEPACEAAAMTDIFEYCFPYGINPKSDEYARYDSTFADHITHCPSCLEKLQNLHLKINEIMERAESDIVTCYNVAKESEESIKEVEATDNIYENWPIKVEVISTAKAAGVSQQRPAALTKTGERKRQKVSSNKIAVILKYFSAAAAIIVLAFIFFNTPAARAVNLGQVYKALGQIKNMYTIVYDERTSEISQELWISQDLNIKMYKTKAQLVLWDLANQVQKEANLNMDSIETIELDPVAASRTEDTMAAPWGLLPFENTASLPRDAEWQQVPNEQIGISDNDTEVYDLTWSDRSLAGVDIFRKYRLYLTTSTTLPYKTELLERRGQEGTYELLTRTNVSYPSTDEIRATITRYGLE
ncbi:MAG: hypothetical protein ACYTEE_08460 [Planctomycetota bacterium]